MVCSGQIQSKFSHSMVTHKVTVKMRIYMSVSSKFAVHVKISNVLQHFMDALHECTEKKGVEGKRLEGNNRKKQSSW